MYIRLIMSELQEKPFDEVYKQSRREQDVLAQHLLRELAVEGLWKQSLDEWQDELAQLTDKALAEYQPGETKPLEVRL